METLARIDSLMAASISGRPAIRMRSSSWQIVAHSIALVVGCVQIRAGMVHVNNGYVLLTTIHSYEVVGDVYATISAATIPYLQMASGLAVLLFPRLRFGGFALSASLFLAFFLAQASVYIRGMPVPCGCFGPSVDQQEPVGWRSLLLAGACLIISIVGVVACRNATRRRESGRDSAAT